MKNPMDRPQIKFSSFKEIKFKKNKMYNQIHFHKILKNDQYYIYIYIQILDSITKN